MPSGKQSKRRRQAAQAPPPPTRTRRQASPRVLIAAGVLVALVVVGIVLGVVLTGGSGNGTSATTAPKLPDAADVQRMLAGIPQHDNVLGNVSAQATVIEYIDLQCPYCQQFETQALPSLISSYVRKGKAKVEIRAIAFIGVDSQRGRAALLAAGMQNKLFNFMQLIYDNQGQENTNWLNDDLITSAAASIPGLDVSRLLSDRNSKAVEDRSKAMDAEASAAGVKSTPTILVGKTGTKPKLVTLTSPSDSATVGDAIDAAIG